MPSSLTSFFLGLAALGSVLLQRGHELLEGLFIFNPQLEEHFALSLELFNPAHQLLETSLVVHLLLLCLESVDLLDVNIGGGLGWIVVVCHQFILGEALVLHAPQIETSVFVSRAELQVKELFGVSYLSHNL